MIRIDQGGRPGGITADHYTNQLIPAIEDATVWKSSPDR
jgi:hypothetical protein